MSTISDFLRSSIAQRIVKIEVLDDDENVTDEIAENIIDGSLQDSDNIGSRRNASITFENSTGLYIPSSTGNIWINKKFRIKTGLLVNEIEYFVDKGVFVCSEPDVGSVLSDTTATIQFLDKFALLDGTLGGTLENTYVIPVGTTITNAVIDILTEAGEIKPPIVEPNLFVTPYTIIKEAGATFGELLIELANMVSYTCFYGEDGFFRFEPPTDILTTGSVWDFSTTEITYLGSSHKYEFANLYNNVIVIGDNVNGITCRGQSSDNSSDIGILAIGKKTKVITDSLIYTQVLAQDRSYAELQKAVSLVETVDLNSMPIDIIKGGDIVTVTDASSGMTVTRFLVKSLNFPLRVQGDMTISAWQGREII